MPTPFRIKQLEDKRWVPDHPEIESVVYYNQGENQDVSFTAIRESLFGAVKNQYPDEYTLDGALDSQKAYLFSKIDQRTRQKISEGFMFEGMTFSLSANAQTNYTAMLAAKDKLNYPIVINTKDDDDTLSLEDAESVEHFCTTALNAAREYIDLGTELKSDIRNATGQEALDAIVI